MASLTPGSSSTTNTKLFINYPSRGSFIVKQVFSN
jgi:hypothetical protein